ncbi:MAG: hypothetical protein SGI77_08975 [Pirellulaceae bacterium]|nr:hypothetical protein [Pirellulaceae bacterium]
MSDSKKSTVDDLVLQQEKVLQELRMVRQSIESARIIYPRQTKSEQFIRSVARIFLGLAILGASLIAFADHTTGPLCVVVVALYAFYSLRDSVV